MTMPYSPGRALFEGNGTATEFPFSFKVWGTEQLAVTLTGPDGLSRPADGWTARLDEHGGSVNYLHKGAPLPEGWKLAITRDMPFEQQIDLVSGTRFDAEVIETGLDRATAERQQLLEQLRRAVILPPTSEQQPVRMAEQLLQAEKQARASATAARNSEEQADQSATLSRERAQAAAASAAGAADSAAQAASSAAAAAQSSGEARQSAEAAATSESHAADSAAAILDLKIAVTTLSPGLPAQADYDPATGILHLAIPKGDSGASAIATPTSLGSVKPQTGDDDGLELEEDGSLRVRKAAPAQRGGVLASPTALAHAVPQAGADGRLDKSWTATCLQLTGGTLAGGVQEAVLSTSGSAVVLDLTAANAFVQEVTGNLSIRVAAKQDFGFQLATMTLIGGGKFPVTWPAAFRWADNTPPELSATGVDVVTFFTFDKGASYYALHTLNWEP